MAMHNETGKDGESLACRHLEKLGFNVKVCNWRSGHYEIDIIAIKEDILHFVEVKTRHSIQFGYPEESVTMKKFRNLKIAAAHYLSRFPGSLKVQFDILSITRLNDKPVEYFLLEDVYIQ